MPDPDWSGFEFAANEKPGKPTKRTPQGGIKATANLADSGVIVQTNADGSVTRELRPIDELSRPEALASLRQAPITNGHPPEPVTSKNWKQYAVGQVGENLTVSDNMLAGTVVIQDGRTCADVERGRLYALSVAYDCELDPTAGVFNGEPYDAIQRNIVFNHVALGEKRMPGFEMQMPGVSVPPARSSSERDDAGEGTVERARREMLERHASAWRR